MQHNKNGLLPVRVLPYNIMDWFLNITPEFRVEFESEILYNGLGEKIIYKIDALPITNIAEINYNQQITLYENFNQYLWCISYSLLVTFDFGVQGPRIQNKYAGTVIQTEEVSNAWKVFTAGLKLTEEFEDKIFFTLPNPEITPDATYIGYANSIYSAALTFILLHEFAHKIYGHLEYIPAPDQSKEEELSADDFAIGKISESFGTERGKTLKIGVVIGIVALMFLNRKLGGGDSHPDLDIRLKNAIEQLELDELDNLWGISALSLNIWAEHFGHEIDIPETGDTYKELFYKTYHQLHNFR